MDSRIPEMIENDFVENETDSGIIWLLKGFIFPCWNGPFYKKAVEKRVIIAILFMVLFAILQTSIVSIQVLFSLSGVGNEIQQAYKRGDIPTIAIEDGIASVEGNKPYVFSENRQLVGIDTTGETQEIDTKAFSQGILITQTDIHFVNEDGYQVFPLTELHEIFGNPIVLDQAQALELWNTVRLVILGFIGVGGLLWNTFIRFGFVALLGLVVWGVVSIWEKDIEFKTILITGIYATVPTFYLNYFLKQVGFSFFGFFTIILLVAWGIAIRYVIKSTSEEISLADIESL